MSTINNRIELVLQHYKYTPRSLSLELGYKGSTTLNNIVSGKLNKPSFDFLIKIIERFDEISLEWLLLGSGDMLKDESSILNIQNVSDYIINNHDIVIQNDLNYKNWFEKTVFKEALEALKNKAGEK